MTDEQIKGIARAINPHWWNDDIDLLNFTRAVLARANQKHPSSCESHADSSKSGEQARALVLADALDNPPGAPLFIDAAAELRRLHAENEVLRQWISEQGLQTDTCTYNILREQCALCRCHRSKA